jgi:ubiquinone biosynthesis protein UbiJ
MWSVSKPQPLAIKMVGDNAIEAGSAEDIADLRASVEALKTQIEMLEQRLEGKQS